MREPIQPRYALAMERAFDNNGVYSIFDEDEVSGSSVSSSVGSDDTK